MSDDRPLHAVLGGSSPVGRAVLDELKRRNLPCVSVERTHKVEGFDSISADMTNLASAESALAQATHIYNCIGLRYSLDIWQRNWPSIMENTIAAAEAAGARLLFLDNIYMYGPAPLQNPITEEHPQSPPSRKGLLRKQIADTLLDAHKSGRVRALIARSADFYGPHAIHSPLAIPLEPMLKGKPGQWLGNPDTPHTYTYTVDAGIAMVHLALADDAYGQAWHLPTTKSTATSREIIAQMAQITGVPMKLSVIPKLAARLIGLAMPILREVNEVDYQYDHPYIFSSAKFEKRFPDFKITHYGDGLQAMVGSFK